MKNSDRNIDDFFKSNLENRNFKMDDQHLKDFENQLDKFNNPKNIDDFFKSKLNKREFSLDDKHLSNLEQQLDQLKRFKSKYWYSAAAALLLLISSLLYINYYENETIVKSTNKQISEENLNINKEDLGAGKTKANDVKKSESISTNQENSKINKPKNSNSKTKKTLETSQRKEVLNTVSKSSTSLDIPTSKISVVTKNTNVLVKENDLENSKDKLAELALNNPKSNSILIKEEEIIKDITTDSTYNNLINPLMIDSTDGFNAINDTSLKEISDTLENVVFLLKDSITDALSQNLLESIIKDSIQKAPDSLQNEMVELYDSMKVEKKFSISFSLGTNYIMKQNSILDLSQGMAPNPQYSQTLEDCIVSLPVDLRVNYNLNNKFSLSTGINTASLGEKIDYNDVHENYMVYDSNFIDTVCNIGTFHIPYYDINTNQMDTAIYSIMMDTSYWINESYEEESINNYNVQNRYSYLNIPFIIGYQFKIKNISIGLRAGGAVGFRINNSKGMYYNSNIQGLHSFKAKKTIYNIVTTASIGYQFKKIEMFIEPKYWFNLTNSILKSDIDHKYHILGLNIGVALRL
ncbi:hypothetical protein OAN44_00665 [Flavobacteriales bacterium]|nr:hypothetical protein [Flavobacteriales bacterium]